MNEMAGNKNFGKNKQQFYVHVCALTLLSLLAFLLYLYYRTHLCSIIDILIHTSMYTFIPTKMGACVYIPRYVPAALQRQTRAMHDCW